MIWTPQRQIPWKTGEKHIACSHLAYVCFQPHIVHVSSPLSERPLSRSRPEPGVLVRLSSNGVGTSRRPSAYVTFVKTLEVGAEGEERFGLL